MFDLTGKVAIVTGASSGIGHDAAVAYAKSGANVCILARRMDRLEELKQEIESMGGRAYPVLCDISDELSVKKAVEQAYCHFQRIDILLNSAGITLGGGLEDTTTADWDNSFATNVRAQFIISKYVVPHMIRQKYGKIVNIASVNAVIADRSDRTYRLAYHAVKAAVVGLTKGMAAAYAKNNITVNAIGPGYFQTDTSDRAVKVFKTTHSTMIPAGRPGKQGELDGTILYLSSDASSYVQGQYICVDGGASIV